MKKKLKRLAKLVARELAPRFERIDKDLETILRAVDPEFAKRQDMIREARRSALNFYLNGPTDAPPEAGSRITRLVREPEPACPYDALDAEGIVSLGTLDDEEVEA